jgi:hypothetical protein
MYLQGFFIHPRIRDKPDPIQISVRAQLAAVGARI